MNRWHEMQHFLSRRHLMLFLELIHSLEQCINPLFIILGLNLIILFSIRRSLAHIGKTHLWTLMVRGFKLAFEKQVNCQQELALLHTQLKLLVVLAPEGSSDAKVQHGGSKALVFIFVSVRTLERL
jgi:hypothetical protein